jgi:hypothetical protein
MRVTEIRELSIPLEGNIANAVVSFAEHTISMVAVVSDVIRNGKPVVGYAFDSIGRFAQGGILRDRMIPRLKAAALDALLDASGPAAAYRPCGPLISNVERLLPRNAKVGCGSSCVKTQPHFSGVVYDKSKWPRDCVFGL